jgi:hypothetical protein
MVPLLFFGLMDRCTMRKITQLYLFISLIFAIHAHSENANKNPKESLKIVPSDIKVPYERPIGFTVNLGSVVSMTFEGRFIWSMFPNISLVVSPSYQNTPELPLYNPQNKKWALFDIKRFNVGVGVRGHFYAYDSWDGVFIEVLGRPGATWAGKESAMFSFTPSFIVGYSTVYESGYTVSFGLGIEWEFLPGVAPVGSHSEFLKTAYWGISKVPLTGELSIGWTW